MYYIYIYILYILGNLRQSWTILGSFWDPLWTHLGLSWAVFGAIFSNWKQSWSRYVRTSWQPQRVVYLARLTLDSFKEVFNRFQALPEKYDPQCFYEQVRTRLKLEVKKTTFHRFISIIQFTEYQQSSGN